MVIITSEGIADVLNIKKSPTRNLLARLYLPEIPLVTFCYKVMDIWKRDEYLNCSRNHQDTASTKKELVGLFHPRDAV